MPNLKPTDIKNEVQQVLQGVPHNSGGRGRSYMTAYQILEYLDPITRDRLIAERGVPGANAGVYYAAASVVADAAQMITAIDIVFLETATVKMTITLQNRQIDIEPGAHDVGLISLAVRNRISLGVSGWR